MMSENARHSDARVDETSAVGPEINPAVEDAPLDAESMAAIRSMLEDDAPAAEPEPAPRPQEAMPAEPIATAMPAAKGEKRDRLPPISAAPEPTAKPKKPQKAPRAPGRMSKLAAPYVARVKGYRPTPKHMIIAALALLVFFRPWLVVGIVLLSLLIFVGVFLILGYDGFWQRGMAVARWYAGRNPERAAEMHIRLDRFAMKWDAVLDRFPDGTVDGLYLPDFQEIAAAEERHEAALDRRLKDIRENKADSLQA